MKKVCDICGGSGQTGSFQGVSRFVITWEECSECDGKGFIEEDCDSKSEQSLKIAAKKKNKSQPDINKTDTP